jgi:hypothetical protein
MESAAAIERFARAAEILDRFAASSGVTGAAPPRRYLWTDAFAVMTWIGLHERTGEPRYLELAQRLIAQVHRVLGGAAPGDPHPTARGVRIGKPLPERRPHEPYDPDLEWERDGQYYHYLTKWMHALQRAASPSGAEHYRRWAAELAQTAHRAFAYPVGAPQRLYWKMSVDLSRPLVPSMGAHDPLDGLVEMAALGLERETQELARMCVGRDWTTDDALGAGGLLAIALRLAQLVTRGREDLRALLAQVLEDAASSVEASAPGIGGAASRRLPFRELGLALGLHAVPPLKQYAEVGRLERFLPLGAELEDFWLEAKHQAAPTWSGHGDINAVTLAACLLPQGTLG